jgi:hypothetical protein
LDHKWVTRNQAAVDHVTPMAHGDDRFDPASLRAAHSACTASVGATVRRPVWEFVLVVSGELVGAVGGDLRPFVFQEIWHM